MLAGRMETYVGLGEVRVKPKEYDMGTGLARDKSFLVVHAATALVVTVILVVPSLVVVLAVVVGRVVPALGLVEALERIHLNDSFVMHQYREHLHRR